MAAAINILDLLDLTCDTKLQVNNIKEYNLKLVLQILVHRLNLTDLILEFRGDDSEIIKNMVQSNTVFPENSNSQYSKISNDYTFKPTGDSKIGLQNALKNTTKKQDIITVESGKIVYNPKELSTCYEKSHIPFKHQVSDFRSQSKKNELSLDSNDCFHEIATTDFKRQPITQLFPSLIMSDNTSSEMESRTLPDISRTSMTHNQSSEENLSEEEKEDIVNSIECATLLKEFSKEYEEFKNIINKMKEIFGKDIGDTLHHIKQAADLAENNRLRQIYFHEEIYKKIQLPDTEDDFTPLRKGPREIVIKKAVELASELEDDQDAKIGDLSPSKEKLIRDENLLFKLVEQVNSSGKKSREEPIWSVTKPAETPQDITVNKLNEIIKEHEDIKCYIEFLIYHINTLADFSEITVPIIFANDPDMEGIQQRIREIRLTPSEYIVTKKIQKDLLEFYKTFILRMDKVESRLNSNTSLILKHNEELYEKCATLSNSINEIQTFIKTMNENLENMIENGNTKEEKVGGAMNDFQEEVNKMNQDQITVSEKQRKILSQLQTLESSLLKLKDEIFHLKAVKLEKIELQKLLSTKADCSLLHSKVSETQFSLAYNDLNSGLNSIYSQLGAQNFIWEALLKKITDKLGIVVVKAEFEKYKKQLAHEIKNLQLELKKLQENENLEAMGTKTKFLRNLTCVSCNKARTMKAKNDYPTFPALPKLPSKGYKKDPTAQDAQRNQSSSSSEFINRYTGGNHTLIKPKEKVFHAESQNKQEIRKE